MQARLILFGLLLGVASAYQPVHGADQTKPYGRACVTLADANGEQPFDGEAQPGEGKSLAVHLDANTPSVAFVAALTRNDRQLANGWLPVLIELGEWEAQRVPLNPPAWEWTKENKPFDVHVFFLARETPRLDMLRALVKAMEGRGRAASLARLQERQLSEILAAWQANDSTIAARPANAPTRLGGTVRAVSAEFPWRDYARSVNFSAERPGVITVRYDGR